MAGGRRSGSAAGWPNIYTAHTCNTEWGHPIALADCDLAGLGMDSNTRQVLNEAPGWCNAVYSPTGRIDLDVERTLGGRGLSLYRPFAPEVFDALRAKAAGAITELTAAIDGAGLGSGGKVRPPVPDGR